MWRNDKEVRKVESDRRKGGVGKIRYGQWGEQWKEGWGCRVERKFNGNEEEKGTKETGEIIMFISFTMVSNSSFTRTHQHVTELYRWALRGKYRKTTNKVPVKLSLRKWSHIFLGYRPASRAEVWSNKRINAELLCAVAKQVSTYTNTPGL